MKIYGAFFIFFISIPLLFASGQEEDGKAITVATDATWPPMEYVDESKEIVGFSIDMFNRVAEEAGLTVTYQNTAWDGIFAGLGNGDYDAILSSVTITEERKERMNFSIPYFNAGQVLVVKTDTDPSISSLADMSGTIVGAQISTSGAFEIQKYSDIELRSYDELGFAMEDLLNGRIDGVVCDTPIAANFVLNNESFRDTLRIAGDPFTEELYGVAVAKGKEELLEQINVALSTLLNNGEIDALKDKWTR